MLLPSLLLNDAIAETATFLLQLQERERLLDVQRSWRFNVKNTNFVVSTLINYIKCVFMEFASL